MPRVFNTNGQTEVIGYLIASGKPLLRCPDCGMKLRRAYLGANQATQELGEGSVVPCLNCDGTFALDAAMDLRPLTAVEVLDAEVILGELIYGLRRRWREWRNKKVRQRPVMDDDLPF